MTVGFLACRLKSDVIVTIKDMNTKKTLWKGKAKDATIYKDVVIDWDFSKGHIIYVR